MIYTRKNKLELEGKYIVLYVLYASADQTKVFWHHIV